MPPFQSKNKKSAVVSVTSTRKTPAPEEETVSSPSQVEPKELRRATLTHIAKELNEVNIPPQREIKKIIRVLGEEETSPRPASHIPFLSIRLKMRQVQ